MVSDIVGPIIVASGAIIAALINAFLGNESKRKTWKSIPINPCFFLVLALVVAIVYLAVPFQDSSDLYPRSDGMIADFSIGPGGPARNAVGENFSPFYDSEYNGDSKCWYKLNWDNLDDVVDGYLRVYYQLEPRREENAESYVGLFTDFSYPPAKAFDVSKFTAITLRIRSSQPVPKDIKVFLTLASTNIPPIPGVYDFPEVRIPTTSISGEWQDISIPLTAFAPPYFSSRGNDIKLDLKKIFRFSLSIRSGRGLPIHGYIDIDNIKFE